MLIAFFVGRKHAHKVLMLPSPVVVALEFFVYADPFVESDRVLLGHFPGDIVPNDVAVPGVLNDYPVLGVIRPPDLEIFD